MGNYLAISAVTTVLQNILKREIQDELDTTLNISTRAPHTIGSEPETNGLNIFLYQLSLNSGYFNHDLPRRDIRGGIISKPLVGLDLHYLLTPFSKENEEIMTQQILASTIRILHEKSVLTRQILEHEFGLIEASDPSNNILNSDLTEQNEIIKLVNKPLSVDELTKLWSSYFQTNYRLSVAYVASPVIIDSKKGPIYPLPVQERKIFVLQFRSSVIEQIEPAIIEWDQDVTKRRIHIIGRNLISEHMKVIIAQKVIPSDHLTIISNERVIVNLPDTANLPDDLSAGIKRLKIVHAISYENGGTGINSERVAYESNTSHFILAPHLITEFPLVVEEKTTFELKFKPPLLKDQKVEIIIGEKTFSQENKNFPTDSISIDTTGWPIGTFLFRLRIDGAESFLQSAPDKTYIGPKIEVIEKNE